MGIPEFCLAFLVSSISLSKDLQLITITLFPSLSFSLFFSSLVTSLCLSLSLSVTHQHMHACTRTHTLPQTPTSLAAFPYLPKTKAWACRVAINFSEWLQATDVSLLLTFHSTFRCCVTFIWSSFMKSVFIKGGLSLSLRDWQSLPPKH